DYGLVVELLLLEDDLGVAAEVREMAARLDRSASQGAIVVIGDGAHDRGVASKRLLDGDRIGHIEPHGLEPPSPVAPAGQEGRETIWPKIGQGHLGHRRILQEIVGAGAPLQPGTEDQHLHERPPRTELNGVENPWAKPPKIPWAGVAVQRSRKLFCDMTTQPT